MDMILAMCLHALEIFVLVLGVAGLVISFLLVFSPNTVKTCSKVLDRKIVIDKTLSRLNRSIQTDSITYRYNVGIGLGLIAGSAFLLIFLFFQLEIGRAVALFADPRYPFLVDIAVGFLVLVEKVAGIAGLMVGFLLMLAPEIMIRIENKMDSWFATQFVVDKLDEYHHGIENIIVRYPLLFGFAGLMTSLVLILLAAFSLLG